MLSKMASEWMDNPRYREICLHKVAWNVMQQGAEVVGGADMGVNLTVGEPMLTVVTEV
jgi:hypothetical protein